MHRSRTSKQKQSGNRLSYIDTTIPPYHLSTDNIILQQHPTLTKPRSQVLPTTPQQAKPAQPRHAVHTRRGGRSQKIPLLQCVILRPHALPLRNGREDDASAIERLSKADISVQRGCGCREEEAVAASTTADVDVDPDADPDANPEADRDVDGSSGSNKVDPGKLRRRKKRRSWRWGWLNGELFVVSITMAVRPALTRTRMRLHTLAPAARKTLERLDELDLGHRARGEEDWIALKSVDDGGSADERAKQSGKVTKHEEAEQHREVRLDQ